LVKKLNQCALFLRLDIYFHCHAIHCIAVESSWLMNIELKCFFMELCLIHVL